MKKHKITAGEIRSTYRCSLEDYVRMECDLCHNRDWRRVSALKKVMNRGDRLKCSVCGAYALEPMEREGENNEVTA